MGTSPWLGSEGPCWGSEGGRAPWKGQEKPPAASALLAGWEHGEGRGFPENKAAAGSRHRLRRGGAVPGRGVRQKQGSLCLISLETPGPEGRGKGIAQRGSPDEMWEAQGSVRAQHRQHPWGDAWGASQRGDSSGVTAATRGWGRAGGSSVSRQCQVHGPASATSLLSVLGCTPPGSQSPPCLQDGAAPLKCHQPSPLPSPGGGSVSLEVTQQGSEGMTAVAWTHTIAHPGTRGRGWTCCWHPERHRGRHR